MIEGGNTIKRLLSAGVALPLLILLILKGSVFLFSIFICLLAFLGVFEFCRMALPQRVLPGVATAAFASILPYLFYIRSWHYLLVAITVYLLTSSIYFLFRFNDIRQVVAECGALSFSILYVPLLLGYLAMLRAGHLGGKWLFLMMFIVMCGDSAAYYLGSLFGRRKLYPAVSPNKSIEGALGGLAGSLVGALVFRYLFFPEIVVPLCLVTALVVGAAGQVGDLFESLLKRSCGVKDSGNIIPGHGGVLDRLDSILFAAPVIWFFSTLM
ncbi:MAG TPA: phosphatidate cytidylyltransferase [Geobacteraceae bacterium]|nr:phosphatidate cytidylyltransferase [Geobacteraceae bacterium]